MVFLKAEVGGKGCVVVAACSRRRRSAGLASAAMWCSTLKTDEASEESSGTSSGEDAVSSDPSRIAVSSFACARALAAALALASASFRTAASSPRMSLD